MWDANGSHYPDCPRNVIKICHEEGDEILAFLEMIGARIVGSTLGQGMPTYYRVLFRQHIAEVPRELLGGNLKDWQEWVAGIVAKFPTAI